MAASHVTEKLKIDFPVPGSLVVVVLPLGDGDFPDVVDGFVVDGFVDGFVDGGIVVGRLGSILTNQK